VRLVQKITGIEEFMRTAEIRSFVRAAESLGLTPSAVSKAVRLLENQLGVRLLHRTTRSVSLTDDGALFYERAGKWLADFDDIQAGLSAGEHELQGMVRIDMPFTYGRVLFMPHLATFLARHPKLTVDVRMNDRYVDLVAEGVDLAIRIGDLVDSALVVRPLGQVSFGTYMSARCAQTFGRPEQPADLLSHRLISFVYTSGRPRKLQYVLDRQKVDIDTMRAVASFNNGEAMIDAVIAGVGIAQLPAFHAQRALESGQVIQVLDGLDAEGPAIQLVYASRRHLARRVRALIDFIGEELAFKT
jgi:LysR family transcriptional regulator for bpeEF and oprC